MPRPPPPPPPPCYLRPPPPLIEDAIDEILLRIPPDDPASLARASAVCRAWRRILIDPAFSGRYRAFHHRAPAPLLGFLRNHRRPGLARFVPTASFRPSATDHHAREVFDCRHGRVLLHNPRSGHLAVWDPLTGDEIRLPVVPDTSLRYCNAAVLCAAAAADDCGHRGCHEGPFLVAFVGTGWDDDLFHAFLYSSVTGSWSAPSSIRGDYGSFCAERRPAALVRDALYFFVTYAYSSIRSVLQYDLDGGGRLSAINLPGGYSHGTAIMPAKDGGVEFVGLVHRSLHVWWKETTTGLDGDAEWDIRRAIDLMTLISFAHPRSLPDLMGFTDADGANVIFLNTDVGLFTIDLKSLLIRKVCEEIVLCCYIFPFMSFYTPACASARLPSPVGSGDY